MHYFSGAQLSCIVTNRLGVLGDLIWTWKPFACQTGSFWSGTWLKLFLQMCIRVSLWLIVTECGVQGCGLVHAERDAAPQRSPVVDDAPQLGHRRSPAPHLRVGQPEEVPPHKQSYDPIHRRHAQEPQGLLQTPLTLFSCHLHLISLHFNLLTTAFSIFLWRPTGKGPNLSSIAWIVC